MSRPLADRKFGFPRKGAQVNRRILRSGWTGIPTSPPNFEEVQRAPVVFYIPRYIELKEAWGSMLISDTKGSSFICFITSKKEEPQEHPRKMNVSKQPGPKNWAMAHETSPNQKAEWAREVCLNTQVGLFPSWFPFDSYPGEPIWDRISPNADRAGSGFEKRHA